MIECTSFDPSCVQFCLVTPVFTSRVKWLLFPSFPSDSASSCQCSWDHYLGLYMGSEIVIGGTERHFIMMGSNISLIVDVLWRDVLIFEQSNGCHAAAKGTFRCTCSGRHFNCGIICATVFANVWDEMQQISLWVTLKVTCWMINYNWVLLHPPPKRSYCRKVNTHTHTHQ